MKTTTTLILLIISLILGIEPGCSFEGKNTNQRTKLRVVLYSYIPDAAGDQFAALVSRIKYEIEQEEPEIDLEINPTCFTGDLYDPDAVSKGLAGEIDNCGLDVVEIDTMLLGDVVNRGALQPWQTYPAGVSFHPAAVAASTINGSFYGVPHWNCGYYLFSRSEAVRRAGTLNELLQALAALQTSLPDMALDLLGDWNLVSLYLDAWVDTYGVTEIGSAISTTNYDASVLSDLQSIAEACQSKGENPCLDGTFHAAENINLPAELFAAGEVNALIGFSENLHVILRDGQNSSQIKLSIAPLGAGKVPILFTDAYLLSRRCTGECQRMATLFVEYMTRASTYEWILMSEDAALDQQIPRYVTPASLDAYNTPKLSQDSFYQTIAEETRNAVNFPNSGIYPYKEKMSSDILEAITSSTN